MQTVIREYIHTIQGPFSVLTGNKFDREVQTYNLCYHWYKAVYNKNPPFTPYTQSQIDTAKSQQGYIDTLNNIEALWTKLEPEGTLSAEDAEDLIDYQNRLKNYLPELNYDEDYDEGALDC